MTFKEALQKLEIEKYGRRIFNSNSRGELSQLHQYIILAESVGTTSWFPDWFESIVDWAEKNWERPQSVFQHIEEILYEQIKDQSKEQNSQIHKKIK